MSKDLPQNNWSIGEGDIPLQGLALAFRQQRLGRGKQPGKRRLGDPVLPGPGSGRLQIRGGVGSAQTDDLDPIRREFIELAPLRIEGQRLPGRRTEA